MSFKNVQQSDEVRSGPPETTRSPLSAPSTEPGHGNPLGIGKFPFSNAQAAGSPNFWKGRQDGEYQHPPVLREDKLATLLEGNPVSDSGDTKGSSDDLENDRKVTTPRITNRVKRGAHKRPVGSWTPTDRVENHLNQPQLLSDRLTRRLAFQQGIYHPVSSHPEVNGKVKRAALTPLIQTRGQQHNSLVDRIGRSEWSQRKSCRKCTSGSLVRGFV